MERETRVTYLGGIILRLTACLECGENAFGEGEQGERDGR